jgi:hypothetical protein
MVIKENALSSVLRMECNFASKQEIQDRIYALHRTKFGSEWQPGSTPAKGIRDPGTCLVVLIASFKEIKLQGDALSSSDQTPEAL